MNDVIIILGYSFRLGPPLNPLGSHHLHSDYNQTNGGFTNMEDDYCIGFT